MIERVSFQESNPMLGLFAQDSTSVRQKTDEKVEKAAIQLGLPHEAEPFGKKIEQKGKNTWSLGVSRVFSRIFGAQDSTDQPLSLYFEELIKNSSDKESLIEMIQDLKLEVKEALLLNKADVLALLTSISEDASCFQKLLACNTVNQLFIFSQAKNMFKFTARVDLYKKLLVMPEEEVQLLAQLIEKGFDLGALFEMKTALDECGSSIGFLEITRGFAKFSKGTLTLQNRSQALTDAILMMVFMEFIKSYRDKGEVFRMLAELKPEVKEAILSNKNEVVMLLRAKLKGPGSLKRLLSQNPIKQQFVFSHAKAILKHDQEHHKEFLKFALYELRPDKEPLWNEDWKVNLYGSIYEELLWISEEEIQNAVDLIKGGARLEALFSLKETMNQYESSISFLEIKRGACFEGGLVGGKLENTTDQLLIILFMEFVKDLPDRSSIFKRLIDLRPAVKEIILMNKTGILSFLRGRLGVWFSLEEVLSANVLAQQLFFSLEGHPYDFIDPRFYQDLLKLNALEIGHISDILRSQKIGLEDLFQMQMVLAELGLSANLLESFRVVFLGAEPSEASIDLVLMLFFSPFIQEEDKRVSFRKVVALGLDVKRGIFVRRKNLSSRITEEKGPFIIEKWLGKVSREVSINTEFKDRRLDLVQSKP